MDKVFILYRIDTGEYWNAEDRPLVATQAFRYRTRAIAQRRLESFTTGMWTILKVYV